MKATGRRGKKTPRAPKAPTGLTVGTMFTDDRLQKFNVSDTVKSMTVKDLRDMEAIFSPEPKKITNRKVEELTSRDLVSLEGLFGDYRLQIIANYRGVEQLERALNVAMSPEGEAVAGDSCCCCSTPCCCCSAAAETDPFGD